MTRCVFPLVTRPRKTNALDKSRICDRRSSSDALAQNYGKQVEQDHYTIVLKKQQHKQNRMVVEFQIHNIEPNLKTIVICKDDNFLHYG